MPSIRESIEKLSDNEFVVRYDFGGGLNSAAEPHEIDVRECSAGENFDLTQDFGKLVSRKPFDKVGTATNGSRINGIIGFEDSSGNVSMLVQAGNTAYSWNGTSFTSRGTVSANARLRGNRDSTSLLDDYVIITDINRSEVVKTWNGSSFSDFSHNLGGQFRAKYCIVDNERAIFANVHSGATATPHVLLFSSGVSSTTASAVGILTISDRPSTSLSASDPFYLPIPDLRSINGLTRAFGVVIVSTEEGQIWQLSGNDASDYSLDGLYRAAAARGDEAIVVAGNDVLYGKQGGIESLLGTLNFGNVESDDVTRLVNPDVNEVSGWTAAYNQRLHKGYWWPKDGNELWVFHQFLYQPRQAIANPLTGSKYLSPWSRWTTNYGNADFRPTAVAVCKRPGDGLECTYFGDGDGNLYQMEGAGAQDGGSDDVVMTRTLPMFEVPYAESYDIEGFISYEKESAAAVTLDFLCQGETTFDERVSISVPAISGANYFGGSAYFGGSYYFGVPFSGRLVRQHFTRTLRTSLFEPKISSTGADIRIADITLKIKATPRNP